MHYRGRIVHTHTGFYKLFALHIDRRADARVAIIIEAKLAYGGFYLRVGLVAERGCAFKLARHVGQSLVAAQQPHVEFVEHGFSVDMPAVTDTTV